MIFKSQLNKMGMDDTNLLVQCDFEVFGHVQGKVHKKVTKYEEIKKILIRSWIHKVLSR